MLFTFVLRNCQTVMIGSERHRVQMGVCVWGGGFKGITDIYLQWLKRAC